MPTDLYSWTWWFFSAIFLSIVINVISDYVKPTLDVAWGKYSKAQEKKNKAEEKKINDAVENILNDSQEIYYIYERRTFWAIRYAANFIIIFLTLIMNMLLAYSPDFRDLKVFQTIYLVLTDELGVENIIAPLLLMGFYGITIFTMIMYRKAASTYKKYTKIVNKYREKRDLYIY